MRIFLIFFSFINALLYFMLYAYYDNILATFGSINVTGGFLSFLKIFLLVIVSFLIGLIVSLLIRFKIEKSFFDWRIALIVGILPFFFLILSQGSVTNYIVVSVFNSSRQVSELIFYFFSRQIVWAMWLGFAIGASVRVAFKKKMKHRKDFDFEKLEQFDEVFK